MAFRVERGTRSEIERNVLICTRLRVKIAVTKLYEVFPRFPNSEEAYTLPFLDSIRTLRISFRQYQ